MGKLFEELDYRHTPIGLVSLRRRRELRLGVDVVEILLGDEHLMSDLFIASEVALADLGLGDLTGDNLDIVVGGLGLGYTAQAVLKDPRVSSLKVVDMLEPVIDWHKQGLLPMGTELEDEPRCELVLGDFFKLAGSDQGFNATEPGQKFDAVLVDIDHAPDFWLNSANASFYEPEGLAKLATHLKPGGVFGLWSNDRPYDEFTDRLSSIFAETRAEEVIFHNPLQEKDFIQTVYLAKITS
jgi:spermidine synthase